MTGRKEGRQLEKLVGRPCHLLQLFYLPWQLSCRSQARLTVAETGKERINLEAVKTPEAAHRRNASFGKRKLWPISAVSRREGKRKGELKCMVSNL